MSNKNDAFLVIRIPKELKDKVISSAKEATKSASKVVREILAKALRD